MRPVPERPGGGRINWLASYPKSGNTWMRMLLANYHAAGDAPCDINAPGLMQGVAATRWLFDTYLGLASNELHETEIAALRPHLYRTIAARKAAPVWLKVHDCQGRTDGADWRFAPDVSGVAVYIVRNPLDVAVSNAFHDGHGDMSQAVDKLGDPATAISAASHTQTVQHIGDWSGHVASWVDHSPVPVLVVRYEDMLVDPAAALAEVLIFAEPEATPDPDRLARAAHHSRFAALRAAEEATGFRETPSGATRFFREGRAGGWRAHLIEPLVERIRAQHGAMMERFGYGTGRDGHGG